MNMAETTKAPPSPDDPKTETPKPGAVKSRPRVTSKAEPLPVSELETAIEEVCRQVVTLRKRPLLVIYYPWRHGSMEEADVEECYLAFRNGGVLPEHRLENCDVLLHTTGGNPVAGYRIAQCIRDFAKDVRFLVPKHAYSAGTLLCFSGNEIRLGHCAGLSPIDITTIEDRQYGPDEVQLASIDGYLQFSDDSQSHIQGVLSRMNISDVSPVGADLLCELVSQVGALKVGEYYRSRTLTGHYAEELLDNYMLAGKPNSAGTRTKIIRQLLFGKPVHEFHMDYHLSQGVGLEVVEMDSEESDTTKAVVDFLGTLVRQDRICLPLSDYQRQPFIAFFSMAKP